MSIFLKGSKRKSTAAIPREYAGQERSFATSIVESVDTLAGKRGDLIDRAVTFRDLLDANILAKAAGRSLTGGGIVLVNPNDPQGTPQGGVEIPPAPVITAAIGFFGGIRVLWTLAQYRGHGFTEIYRHPSDDISSAFAAGAYAVYTPAGGGFYFDVNVGSQSTFYYWVRAVNINGVAGPFNDQAGTSATTPLDYEFISGKIDEILADDLSNLGLTTRLDGVDSKMELTDTKFSVKIDSAGHVAGFGLIVDDNEYSGTSSAFIVAADKFAIAADADPTTSENNTVGTKFPFKVITTPFNLLDDSNQPVVDAISGQNIVVPAGVYIDDAFIHNGQITTATIGVGTITTAHIGDAQITDATIANSISSVGWNLFGAQAGGHMAGWALFKDGNGGSLWADNAYITGAIVANTLTLSAGAEIKTLQIDGNAVTVPVYTEFTFPDYQIPSATQYNTPVDGSNNPNTRGAYRASGGRLLITCTFGVRTNTSSQNNSPNLFARLTAGTDWVYYNNANLGSSEIEVGVPQNGATEVNIKVTSTLSVATSANLGTPNAAGVYNTNFFPNDFVAVQLQVKGSYAKIISCNFTVISCKR